MNIVVDLIPQTKDHHELHINGAIIGTFERSQLRQLIQEIDNSI